MTTFNYYRCDHCGGEQVMDHGEALPGCNRQSTTRRRCPGAFKRSWAPTADRHGREVERDR